MNNYSFSTSETFTKKLERVKSLMSSKYPKGCDMETLFGECLDAYLEKHDPQMKEKRRQERRIDKPPSRIN